MLFENITTSLLLSFHPSSEYILTISGVLLLNQSVIPQFTPKAYSSIPVMTYIALSLQTTTKGTRHDSSKHNNNFPHLNQAVKHRQFLAEVFMVGLGISELLLQAGKLIGRHLGLMLQLDDTTVLPSENLNDMVVCEVTPVQTDPLGWE